MQHLGALCSLDPQPASTDSPSFDVVLVHGRGINAHKIWAPLWSQECVKFGEQRTMRVFGFEYRDLVNSSYRVQSIRMSAEKLLKDLISQRSGNTEMRAIVFIGHSTGGVIIKQALILARRDPRFRNIAYSACATVFFATPHRGYEDVIPRIFDADSLNRRVGIKTPFSLVREGDIKSLNDISTEFLELYGSDLLFRNYVESSPPEGCKNRIVEEDNASLGSRWPDEISDQNHFQICTFVKAGDGPEWLKLFTDHEYFRTWFDWLNSHRKLWITGELGCGKTFLAEHIRLLALNQLRTDPYKSDLVIFFWLGSMKGGLITPRKMLACLLHSILVSYPEVAVFPRQQQSGPSTDEDVERLWYDTIVNITGGSSPRRLTLILDEVDRLVENHNHPQFGPVLRVLSGEPDDPTIRSELDPNRIRVLVFSRPGGHHSEALKRWCNQRVNQIPQNETKGDIKKTVEKRLDILARIHKLHDQVKADISEEIRHIAGNMYIVAHLALIEIANAPEKESVRSRIRNSIAGFYDSILGRLALGDKAGGETNEVNRFLYSVLFWMAHQGHAMNAEELQIGLAMLFKVGCPVGSNSYQGVVDKELASNPKTGHPNLTRDILLKCTPLVRRRSDGCFELIHRTLNDFLTTAPEMFETLANLSHHRHYALGDARADEIISSLCVDYLLLPFFEDAGKMNLLPKDWVDKVKKRMDDNLFVAYAARHWIYHAKLSSTPLQVNWAEVSASSCRYHLLDFSKQHAISWAEVWWYYVKWPEKCHLAGSTLQDLDITERLRRTDLMQADKLNLARGLTRPPPQSLHPNGSTLLLEGPGSLSEFSGSLSTASREG
ncbi:predicted protein [Chaetomium globosum CBS 148.51]|uniref:Nephrocystin 3-like N-terminal domain-containing protein n=1 Tax=Chaetomium globosum (strain ATCC 6205 / CBS 148.51 / DSM 1962 / NBRC 6347 / NRRL 1970) TaxID=306901 RepID=Q2HBY8_CHAGB|nr:uncharacterized protein CHGG_02266 [Chaetomium globosum CBS 148.51]EAQ90331.1 predicted protein [Chaetomium globosum CBS 148.51]